MMIALTKGSIGLLRYILINYLRSGCGRSPERTPIAQILSSSNFFAANIHVILPGVLTFVTKA
ncbi:MAG: hypothetical protein JGK17_01150 [Microcoleus sp. PH2017_10_PVI_O_A]|uniref:hypothetical protein n=1 Tax=unclassified Microcoleus TaxID=2642155 RepID=UPI001D5B899E|nr:MULTISPECIES: hypothetical protein [unclassified Microcoleus]MCC3557774.1 hypothetical protein [Microcoleus sp. PH2017_27_LUM_O_A]TAE85766.1 MAG: hypothetical protein EAZ83_01560 [Oscillatoriales cyanobacterium]MCC3404226.1 hypothetical protein [Microcoleus sp. PH2017_10_PVI_O_A]MCC3527258.1 hypothetical protein [Microcoleus sp. PH2017_21_RUC_O_A]TAF22623.1 MAG: hypothetical protein EAZ73_04535 [Oscillatoriales cyanobacterium]